MEQQPFDNQLMSVVLPEQRQWLLDRYADGTVGASKTGQPYVTKKGWDLILELGQYHFPEDADPLNVQFVQEARGDGDIATLWDAIGELDAILFVKYLNELEGSDANDAGAA